MSEQQQVVVSSSSINLFELAVRKKWRFQREEGGRSLSVEDLFDIPLDHHQAVSLNALAVETHNKIQSQATVSFVSTVKKDETLEQKLELLKLVIKIKLDEQAAKEQRAAKAAKRKQLTQLLAQKQAEAQSNASIDEIQKLIDELGDE